MAANRPSAYDRPASIEYKNITVDDRFGTDIVDWLRLVSGIWVRVIQPVLGRAENSPSGLYLTNDQVRIEMRYRPDVTSEMRIILHGGGRDEVYNIISGPVMVGRQEELAMVCERFKKLGDNEDEGGV